MFTDPELASRLENYELDSEEAEFPFSKRLARDNGWDEEFAVRVVDEYKKFLYLSQIADHELTPSDEVDQAWHLHLTYSQDYWDHLCADVLRRPFHHGPTKGGNAEAKRYVKNYSETRQVYLREFGKAPPTDIWPSEAVRFGEAPSYRRINTDKNWVIPKSIAQWFRPKWLLILLSFLGLVVISTAFLSGLAPFRLIEPLTRGLMAALGVIIAAQILRLLEITFFGTGSARYRSKKKGSSSGCGGNSGTGCGGCSGCGGAGCGGCGG